MWVMNFARNDNTFCLDDECEVVIATSPGLIRECQRLRYQVYSLERGFEPGHNGLETDAYDSLASHVLLVHRVSGEPIGTVRVIPPSERLPVKEFPMAHVCAKGLLDDLPAHTTGEISRFAVSKARRMGCGASSMVRLGLMRGVLSASIDLGLTHWCAIMEPVLLRLLQRNAIHFAGVGPPVDYHGLRQPAYADIGRVLGRTRFEQRKYWEYVTMDGTLWPSRFWNSEETIREVA
jgi:N-acyl-L-homoserine lactone synthetase